MTKVRNSKDTHYVSRVFGNLTISFQLREKKTEKNI